MNLQYLQIIFQVLILCYFLVLNSFYTLLDLLAFLEVRKQYKRSFIDDHPYFYRSKLAPGASLLVPAHNEETTIEDSVLSQLSGNYPKFDVIVINDGSTDRTLEVLKKRFQLQQTYRVLRTEIVTQKVKAVYRSKKYPRLIVVDKENGGKSDALNAGINTSRQPYIISLDADVILEKDAVLKIMKPMFENPEQNIAAGGIVRIANGCRIEKGEVKEVGLSQNPLPVFQVIEYMRAFNAGRTGFARMNCLMIVSGAFGVFNTEQARLAGGYDPQNITEDMELIVRFHRSLREQRKKYRVLYLPYPVCWTEAPETFKILSRQRDRWHRGLCQVMHKNTSLLFNPRYGRIGWVGMPYFYLFEYCGPLIELAGYFYFIYLLIFSSVNWLFMPLFIALAILWGVLFSVLAILFEEMHFNWYKKFSYLLRLLWFALIENFGYRQLTVLWRVSGFISYLFGKKGWGVMPRKGFSK